MKENQQNLWQRIDDFALSITPLYISLPKTTETQVVGKQALRSGTSIGAHYPEACRAKSDADFISKIEGALQELDETDYWLSLLTRSGVVTTVDLDKHRVEIDELIRIFVIWSTKLNNAVDLHPSAFIFHPYLRRIVIERE